jgi:putative flavoprotein involved in K+ transport
MDRFGTVVIGGGQAGLAMGYYLRRLGESFVILEADERVGDSWRRRYDSLRLFSMPRYASLPGMRIPGNACPTRDQMADYLER